MGCGIGPRPSRDSRRFGVQPSVETLGYFRLSLRDNKAAVCPCGRKPTQNRYVSEVSHNDDMRATADALSFDLPQILPLLCTVAFFSILPLCRAVANSIRFT